MLPVLKYKRTVLRTVMILLLLGLAWNMAAPGGWITGFFIEYWVHFALGSLLYFVLCETLPIRTPRVLFCCGLCLLAAVSVWQLWPLQWQLIEDEKRVYVEWLVLSVACLLLYVLRPFSEAVSQSVIWKPIALVGTISYSLYLVHQFNLRLVDAAVARVIPASAPAPIHIFLSVLLHIGIGAAFWWLCERPFLSRQPKQSPILASVTS